MVDWPRILIEIAVHYGATHLLIVFARRIRWLIFTSLAAVVAGLIAIILLAIPPIKPADLVRVPGVLERYWENSGYLCLYLQNNAHTFCVYDEEFFSHTAFLQEVHAGDTLTLAVLERRYTRVSEPLVVFEVTGKSETYLASEPLLAIRDHERRITLPLVLLCTIAVLAMTVVAFISPRPAYDAILGVITGGLLTLIVDFYFPKTSLSGAIPYLALPVIFPLAWLVETRLRKVDKTDIRIVSINYIVMVAIAVATLLLLLHE